MITITIKLAPVLQVRPRTLYIIIRSMHYWTTSNHPFVPSAPGCQSWLPIAGAFQGEYDSFEDMLTHGTPRRPTERASLRVAERELMNVLEKKVHLLFGVLFSCFRVFVFSYVRVCSLVSFLVIFYSFSTLSLDWLLLLCLFLSSLFLIFPFPLGNIFPYFPFFIFPISPFSSFFFLSSFPPLFFSRIAFCFVMLLLPLAHLLKLEKFRIQAIFPLNLTFFEREKEECNW